MKVVAVTGTPGTGKTTFSKKLAAAINAEVLSLRDLIEREMLFEKFDEVRDTRVVDVGLLKRRVDEIVSGVGGDLIIDGLMSEGMSVSHIVVLRANPLLLGKRLFGRGYSKAKVMENVEAEVMGVCLYDSLWCDNVLEVDATQEVDLNAVLAWLSEGGRKIIEVDWMRDFRAFLSESSSQVQDEA